MEKTRKKYTLEYKIFAVTVSGQYGSASRAAQELDISISNIYHWKRLISKGKLTLQNKSNRDPKRNELQRLRKEIKNTRIERDIIKKAPSIFSKRDGRDTNLSGKIAIYFPSGRCAKFFR